MELFVREMTEDATVISETVAPQAVMHCSLSGKIAGFVRKNAGSNPASAFSVIILVFWSLALQPKLGNNASPYR